MNSKSQRYDAIVIGAGQAGPSLTARLAGAGKSVAIIERHLLGGTCVNSGCTPTKTLIASARIAYDVRRAGAYGVGLADGAARIDLSVVQARKNRVVEDSRAGLETWLTTMKNCTVHRGHARFESAHQVRVGGTVLEADQIFINVGCRPRLPAFPGIDAVRCMTSTSLLRLEVLPKHLIIVGGSYIGLEFAQMYRRFGSEVTVIEKDSRLIPREDAEISAGIREALEAEGITVRTDAECIRFATRGANIIANVNCVEGEPSIEGSHVLLAVGRQPNTDDLGVLEAGIDTDGGGYIRVDDALRTSVPGVWALGDCNGRGAFTHTSYNDYEIVAANLLDNSPRRVSERIPCYALFVDPPLGRVGLTEHEAVKQGYSIRVGKRPMTRVSRAVEKGETRGLMKVLVDAKTDLILGAAIFGVGGDEAIHSVIDIMTAKAPYTALKRAVHIHPTVSELIPTILGELQNGGST
jgi:pyruvate/2-oxoglutarate dehydrogenase complex dihydrolipoamide dehydrogenase (E3) component